MSICTGAAIISFHLKTVYLILWLSVQNWSVPTNTCYSRKLNTLGKLYWLAISPHGPSTVSSINVTIDTISTIQRLISSDQHITSNNSGSNNRNISIIVPYTKGHSERFKKTCNSLSIQVHFKGHNTIQTLFMAPRTKTTNAVKVG